MNIGYKSFIITALAFFAVLSTSLFAEKMSLSAAFTLAETLVKASCSTQEALSILPCIRQELIFGAKGSTTIEKSLVQKIVNTQKTPKSGSHTDTKEVMDNQKTLQTITPINSPKKSWFSYVTKACVLSASLTFMPVQTLVQWYKADAASASKEKSDLIVPDKLKHVKQVSVTTQKGLTCGYHALFNVWAMQQLHKAKQPITSASIIKKTQEVMPLIESIEHVNLYSDEILQVHEIFNFNLADTFLMDARKTHHIELIQPLDNNIAIAEKTYSDTIKKIKAGTKKEAYFIINTPGHWVAAAYINGTLYYADSVNSLLSVNSHPHCALEHLSTLLGLT